MNLCKNIDGFVRTNILMDLVLWGTSKATEEDGIQWRSKTLLDIDYSDDLSVPDENVSKMNELLEVLRVQSATIDLKINF